MQKDSKRRKQVLALDSRRKEKLTLTMHHMKCYGKKDCIIDISPATFKNRLKTFLFDTDT